MWNTTTCPRVSLLSLIRIYQNPVKIFGEQGPTPHFPRAHWIKFSVTQCLLRQWFRALGPPDFLKWIKWRICKDSERAEVQREVEAEGVPFLKFSINSFFPPVWIPLCQKNLTSEKGRRSGGRERKTSSLLTASGSLPGCEELLKEMSCLFECVPAIETFANHLWFFKNLGVMCEPFLEITYVHLCYHWIKGQ